MCFYVLLIFMTFCIFLLLTHIVFPSLALSLEIFICRKSALTWRKNIYFMYSERPKKQLIHIHFLKHENFPIFLPAFTFIHSWMLILTKNIHSQHRERELGEGKSFRLHHDDGWVHFINYVLLDFLCFCEGWKEKMS